MHKIKKSRIVITGMKALVIIVMIVAIIIIEMVTMEEPQYKI